MTYRWKQQKLENGWVVVSTDTQFQNLFTDVSIIKATDRGPEGVSGDVYWELSDGSWLAMEVEVLQGCPTCGPEVEKHFWHRPPRPEEQHGK